MTNHPLPYIYLVVFDPRVSGLAMPHRTLQPVTTVVLSVVFLHTAVEGHEIFGGVVIAVGLLVTIYGKGLERRGSTNRLRAKQNRCDARHARLRWLHVNVALLLLSLIHI